MKLTSEQPLVRYLAACGYGSRRTCDNLILTGQVKINGEIAQPGSRVNPFKDSVTVNGQSAELPPETVYILLNKPRGYLVSASDPEGRPLAKDLLPEIGTRLFPVGRLDFQTEGAILFTNDGLWANNVAHPRNEISKTYMAKVRGIPTVETLEKWRRGVRDKGELLRAREVKIDRITRKNAWLKVTLTGGVNRQVRRMGKASGHPVVKLMRIAVGPVELASMPSGHFRYLHTWEVKMLLQSDSSEKSRPTRTSRRNEPAGKQRGETRHRKPAGKSRVESRRKQRSNDRQNTRKRLKPGRTADRLSTRSTKPQGGGKDD
jgi:23S rRNA pseudouridine2605 synthase